MVGQVSETIDPHHCGIYSHIFHIYIYVFNQTFVLSEHNYYALVVSTLFQFLLSLISNYYLFIFYLYCDINVVGTFDTCTLTSCVWAAFVWMLFSSLFHIRSCWLGLMGSESSSAYVA